MSTDLLDEKKAEFIRIISEGGTLDKVAAELKIHRTTPLRWLREDDGGDLRNQYAHARADQGDLAVDDIKEITERLLRGEIPPDVARVAIQSKQWEAGKRKPKVYGDKLELSGDEKSPLTVNVITHFKAED